MKYKIKQINLKKLKNYINANTKTENRRNTKRIYNEVCDGYEQRI